MLAFDRDKVLANAHEASTEYLLDRVTAFRIGLEAEAIEIFEQELVRRGISTQAIESRHTQVLNECLFWADGCAVTCSCCHRPAVAKGWSWQRLFRVLPVFPRRVYTCKTHRAG